MRNIAETGIWFRSTGNRTAERWSMNMTENALLLRQYLTFLLAGEEYAVPVLRVKEILEYEVVTRVPKAPLWVHGVFNLRGSVVPVVDLAVKFGIGDTPISKTTCVIIMEIG